MHHVRTTMQPHKVICVSSTEYLDLKRQGLIYAEESGVEPSLPKSKASAEPADSKKGA